MPGVTLRPVTFDPATQRSRAVVAVMSSSETLPSFRKRFSMPVAKRQTAGFESETPVRCETATSSAFHSRLPGSSLKE